MAHMRVIGVAHVDRYKKDIYDYVQQTGLNKNIMLELDPHDATRFESFSRKKPEKDWSYFYWLKHEFSKTAEVIEGDIHKTECSSIGLAFADYFIGQIEKYDDRNYQPTNLSVINDLVKITGMSLAGSLLTCTEASLPSNMRKRNQGLIETIEKEQPETTIVGAAHAFAIKKAIPQMDFELFLIKRSPLTYYPHIPSLSMFAAAYQIMPDKVVWR